MGFGLLWTALIRRLSAVTLFVIFNAAVYPFGRLDLVGHALIMAVIVIIFADPTPQMRFALRRTLVATLTAFAMIYWGLHHVLYGVDGRSGVASSNNSRATHAPDPERTHGAPAAPSAGGHGHGTPVAAAGANNANPDQVFVRGMIEHHRSGIEMAQIQLREGKDAQQRKLAQEITTQQREIDEMTAWLKRNGG